MELAKIKQYYNRYWDSAIGYKVLTSTPYMLALTVVSAIFFNLNLAIESLLFFACILIVSMLFSKDLSPCLLPLLLVSMSVLKMYGSQFEDYLVLVAPVIILTLLLILRPFYAHVKMRFGYMFIAMFFAGVALAMGGIGSISVEQYFDYVTIFYVLGLGFGMALVYLIMRCYTFSGGVHQPCQVLTKTMLCVGLMGIFMIMPVAIDAIINNQTWSVQWSNNLSTIMIFCIPFAFYKAVMAKRFNVLWFLYGALETLATLLTLSRGGILFASVTFLISAIYSIVVSKKRKLFIVSLLAIFVVAIATLLTEGTIDKIMQLISISSNEARVSLVKIAIDNFINNPIFGAGMGFKGEYYYPQDWALYWYHSLPFQIIGAMGLVGVGAYVYLFYKRVRLCFKTPTKFSMIALIAIIGFTLMGCVNPGEFAPVPYAVLMCLLPVYVELSFDNCDARELMFYRSDTKLKVNFV